MGEAKAIQDNASASIGVLSMNDQLHAP